MSPLNTINLLFNGLTLALALGFLLIVLWHDISKEVNQFFGVFLFWVTLWNAGSLLTQGAMLVDPHSPLIDFAVNVLEIGFTGASIAIYVLTTVLVDAQTRRFRLLAFTSLLLILVYQTFLIVTSSSETPSIADRGSFTYLFQPLSIFFYFAFDTLTFYLVWRYRRKIRSAGLIGGIVLFLFGQSIGFLNPELQVVAVSTTVSSIGALIISFSVLRLEILTPLAERISQVEAMHQVSLAITSQIRIDTVLDEIAIQAVGWLGADGAGIFLNRSNYLELASVYNLPKQFIHTRVTLGEGVAGSVAASQKPVHLENYGRDWRGKADLPLAKETFGSVSCVPLIYGGEVIGVLMVVSGNQGRLFDREDMHLLELLGGQAAVAIAHSRLFAEQRQLTHEVDSARSQLETVLVSTENPVIAVDREFRLNFANPAARNLFSIPESPKRPLITDILPSAALPPINSNVLRELRRKRVYVYEISLNNRVYLCHLAGLGRPRTAGWVAVLNDVTQLKELDRLKSEMVRWASHDLKNPLTAALLYLDLLRDDLLEGDEVEVQQSLAIIEKQLERMNRIIRGILDLERLKTVATPMELCHPESVIHNAIDEMEHLANERQIILESVVDVGTPDFLGDSQQFERALINLIENAIKFTPTNNGKVWVSARKDGDKVVFAIKDQGIGIPARLHEQVFDRFFRGGQSGQQGANHVSGSGLGLSLVKTIVENHQGKISLESEEGKGSTFFIVLPAVSDGVV